MYNLIDQKRSVRKIYTENLIGRGDITLEEAEQALRDFQEQLERVSPRRVMTWSIHPNLNRNPNPTSRPGWRRRSAIRPRHIANNQVDLPARPDRSQPAPPAARTSGAHGRGRHDRLGDGRDHRLRVGIAGGSHGAPGRAGFAPRHLRSNATR